MLCYKCLRTIEPDSATCPSCRQTPAPEIQPRKAEPASRGEPLSEGTVIGQYTIRELVGEGPFGRVYKVLDTQFDVIASLKILHDEIAKAPGVRSQTLQVYRELAAVDADHLVKVYDALEVGGRVVIATDYLEGLSLTRLIDMRGGAGAKFKWEEAEPIIDAVCTALESLNPGEVFGDLKPQNVVILPDAVLLTDRGLTAIMPPETFVAAQAASDAPYLAPELMCYPERLRTDPAVDVYAVGALLYQLLTGTAPGTPLQPASELGDGLPAEMDALLAKALAPNPNDRFANVAALHLEIAKLTGKNESAAKAEICLQQMPERAPFVAPAAEPPPAPAAPEPPAQTESANDEETVSPASSKSLFDDELLGEITTDQAAPQTAAASTQSKSGGNKALLPIVAVLVLVALGAGAFFFMGGDDSPSEVQLAEQAEIQRLAEEAREALARAEKARDDAIAVDANRDAAEPFLAAMQHLRAAGEKMRHERYSDAVSSSAQAAAAFDEAIIAAVAAQKAEQERRQREEEEARRRQAQATAAAPQPAAARRPAQRCPDGSVYIPRGAFLMGSPANDFDRNPGEKVNESTTVAAYCIDQYEFPNRKGARPRSNVNWVEARQLCHDAGKRLCTEEEWERACKGPDNLRFPYGASFDANKCNTEDAAGNPRQVAASGSFAACRSGYGVYDMSGNLWEWTSSQLQQGMHDRVLRSGSSTRPDYQARCANRYNSLPRVKDQEFGFRCCADPNE